MTENAIVTAEPKFDTQSISTIDSDSVEAKLEVVAAVNAATSLNEYVEENGTDAVINVTNIFTMPGVRKSRVVGQPDMPCQNTYLITADGECLMSQSDGIYRSAAMIVAMFPTLELSEGGKGMKMRVQTKKLANGNTIKSLVPIR